MTAQSRKVYFVTNEYTTLARPRTHTNIDANKHVALFEYAAASRRKLMETFHQTLKSNYVFHFSPAESYNNTNIRSQFTHMAGWVVGWWVGGYIEGMG